MNAKGRDESNVRADRGTTVVHRTRSIQSRLASLISIGMVLILGLGFLTWYYTSALRRPAQVKLDAQASLVRRAQGDAVLPPLGRVDAPSRLQQDFTADAPIAAPVSLQEIPLESEVRVASQATPPAKTPAEIERERRLGGAAYVGQSAAALAGAALTTGSQGGPPDATPLVALLRPSAMTAVRAERLPTTRLLLPKGAFIDCTLETAIDSTLPGMTTCVTATDSFGADGQVVLLERGTKLVGEVRGQVQQGAARLFVLWSEARTPTGVIVPLASPGTDELGRAGLSGSVERHFWQRFGAALLVSVVDGAVQAGVQASSRGGGPLVYDPSGAQGVMTEILKNTVNIAPTITKRQGDRIQVLVARDLDFRSVYELRAGGQEHD
jgi:type IV secretion system protein VirB10